MLKRPAFHFFVPVLAMLALPFIYNSCQGGLFKGKGFAAATHRCKVGLYNGRLAKLSDLAGPRPFASGKVQLSASGPTQAQAKTTAEILVKAGETLGVMLDNACLQRGETDFSSTIITQAALKTGQPFLQMEQQVYLWKLERDYSEGELQALAQNENCLTGISWNQTYKLQTFNDPGLVNQPYLPVIRAEEAYVQFYGNAAGMIRSSGTPVQVAVIDSGVDWNHPDLSAKLWRHAHGIGIDITTLGGTVSYNPMDVSPIGHGTHISGMIAAVADNAQGIAGAMPFRAEIMPIKIYAVTGADGEISTTSKYLADAITFAKDNGASVINLSLGKITSMPNSDPLVEEAIAAALAKGATVVTVTGNAEDLNGAEINGRTLSVMPGMYSTRAGVIGVGSIDTVTGTKSPFSHYSTTYGEIAAPGAEQSTVGLYSTLPNNSYGRRAGTSQSAPLVSAAAGLVVGWIREITGVAPPPAEVERLILSSAVKDARLQPYFKDGNRLDLLNLVQKIKMEYSGGNSMDLSSLDCPQ